MNNQVRALRPKKRRRRLESISMDKSFSKPLPEDVLIDILSRLPTKDVIKYRSVCRRWKALTSTQYFAEMHMQRDTRASTILVQEKSSNHINRELYIVGKWEAPRKRASYHRVQANSVPAGAKMCFSYNGLILFRHEYFNKPEFIIFNPITQVGRIIEAPAGEGEVYGIFFHPSLKEYCIIWGRIRRELTKFQMYNLGSKSSWREIKAGASVLHKPKVVYGLGAAPPVVIDDVLYWMVESRYDHEREYLISGTTCQESIMSFDIKREKFTVMSHPEITNRNCGHDVMELLRINGRLSLFVPLFLPRKMDFEIWSLKDSTKSLWIKSHTFNFNIGRDLRILDLHPFAFVNGELLVYMESGKFWACNLQLGTFRKLGRKYMGSIRARMVAHVPTLVSPYLQ